MAELSLIVDQRTNGRRGMAVLNAVELLTCLELNCKESEGDNDVENMVHSRILETITFGSMSDGSFTKDFKSKDLVEGMMWNED